MASGPPIEMAIIQDVYCRMENNDEEQSTGPMRPEARFPVHPQVMSARF
jgi:hypothetical protein